MSVSPNQVSIRSRYVHMTITGTMITSGGNRRSMSTQMPIHGMRLNRETA